MVHVTLLSTKVSFQAAFSHTPVLPAPEARRSPPICTASSRLSPSTRTTCARKWIDTRACNSRSTQHAPCAARRGRSARSGVAARQFTGTIDVDDGRDFSAGLHDTRRHRREQRPRDGEGRRRGCHAPLPGSTDSTRMPSSTGVRHAWRSTPSTRTRHSWQTPIMQKAPRGLPVRGLRRTSSLPAHRRATATVSPARQRTSVPFHRKATSSIPGPVRTAVTRFLPRSGSNQASLLYDRADGGAKRFGERCRRRVLRGHLARSGPEAHHRPSGRPARAGKAPHVSSVRGEASLDMAHPRA